MTLDAAGMRAWVVRMLQQSSDGGAPPWAQKGSGAGNGSAGVAARPPGARSDGCQVTVSIAIPPDPTVPDMDYDPDGAPAE